MKEAGAASPNLDEEEQEQAAKHAPLRSAVIHEILREQGEAELERPLGALVVSALAAGLSMGFSFLAMALIRSGLPDAPWRHMIASFGYTIGFAIVVLGRQQLFTENTLTAVLPTLTRRDGRTLAATLRLWGAVLVGNIVGTWLFAAAISWPPLVRPEVYEALRAVSRESIGEAFAPTLVKAVFAGWLIALMVWLTPSARSAKLLVIVLMTWLIALGRFSHIIAGSSEAAFGVLLGQIGAVDYLWRFFVPTLIGNIVGGVLLVAMLNHAPVADEVRGEL